MNDRERDRTLSEEEMVEPSPDFVLRVMEAVREDAAALPPISFPWARALPLVLCWPAAVAGLLWACIENPGSLYAAVTRALQQGAHTGVDWIVMALLVSWTATTISFRLAGKRPNRERQYL